MTEDKLLEYGKLRIAFILWTTCTGAEYLKTQLLVIVKTFTIKACFNVKHCKVFTVLS